MTTDCTTGQMEQFLQASLMPTLLADSFFRRTASWSTQEKKRKQFPRFRKRDRTHLLGEMT